MFLHVIALGADKVVVRMCSAGKGNKRLIGQVKRVEAYGVIVMFSNA